MVGLDGPHKSILYESLKTGARVLNIALVMSLQLCVCTVQYNRAASNCVSNPDGLLHSTTTLKLLFRPQA